MGNHRIWRAQAKKIRRKRIRQQLAQERDETLRKEQERKENSPKYKAWLSEQRALELFAEEEEARLSAEQNACWLAEEERAQKAWKERQERLALARAERAKQEIRIREEWEEEQKKLKAIKEEQERIAAEKQQQQEQLMRQIEKFINKGCDMPPEVNVASVTNPDRPFCPFFTKTGACRFGDRCSRNHTRPAISRVLLVPNFYDHIGLRQMNPDELEAADDWLEYEDSETYHHFLDFYEDVLPEWERVGKISQFKVCCNFEPHLRGNVYIEYESAQDAVKAFKLFHGRFYGGKQINVEFVTIESWKAAICGQFHKHCCPKGRACNFLHVFRNPRNAFYAADRDRQEWRRKLQRAESPSPHRSQGRSWSGSPENNSRRREWRWSASPSPPSAHHHNTSRNMDSVRSHQNERDDSTHRKRSKRRRDGISSERSMVHSSERSQVRERQNQRYEESHHSSRYKRRSSNLGDDFNQRGSPEVDKRSLKSKKSDIRAHSDETRGSFVEGCESKEENCDILKVPNNSSVGNKHVNDESESDQDSKSVVGSQHKRKDKKSKKKKKKNSHRKEKRRKRKLYDVSDSSDSGDK